MKTAKCRPVPVPTIRRWTGDAAHPIGLDRTTRSVVSALASLAVAFTMIRFGIARQDRVTRPAPG